jgi:hypothetical protein
MDMNLYLAALRRYWLLPILLVLISLGCAYGYSASAASSEAEATVAVLDPLIARPGGYTSAQVTIDAIVKSQELANRVALQVHEPAKDVHSRLSVALIPSLSPQDPSPLYAIRGKDKTQAKAIALTSAATSEANTMYVELNRPDSEQVRVALSPESAAAAADLSKARADLDQWERDNDVLDFPVLLAGQNQLVLSARMKLHELEILQAGLAATYGRYYQTTLDYRGIVATKNQQQAVVNQEQGELGRLRGFEVRYTELSHAVEMAQNRVTQLSAAREEMIVGQLVPMQSSVKVLDHAQPVSLLVTEILIYGSAVILGLSLAALCIYALASYAGRPVTAEAIAAAFDAPVLVRFARAG